MTHVKLFLVGETVRAGLAVDELIGLAETASLSVVVPNGRALSALYAGPRVKLL